MATEMEFVNYKEFVAGLSETESLASTDKVVVSNPTNGPRSMPGSAKDRTTTLTAFREGDVIPVDGETPAKMPYADFLRVAAENAFERGSANKFYSSVNYLAGDRVSHLGYVWEFRVDHPAGDFDSSEMKVVNEAQDVNIFKSNDAAIRNSVPITYTTKASGGSWNGSGKRLNLECTFTANKSYRVSVTFDGVPTLLAYTASTSNTDTIVQRIIKTEMRNNTLTIEFKCITNASWLIVRDISNPSTTTTASATIEEMSFPLSASVASLETQVSTDGKNIANLDGREAFVEENLGITFTQLATGSWNNSGRRLVFQSSIVNGKRYKVDFSFNALANVRVFTGSDYGTEWSGRTQAIADATLVQSGVTMSLEFTATADASYLIVRDYGGTATSASGKLYSTSLATLDSILSDCGKIVDKASFAEDFATNKSFINGRKVVYSKKIYRFLVDHYGAWDDSQVEDYIITDEIDKSQYSADKALSVLDTQYRLSADGGNWNGSGNRLNFDFKFKAGKTYKIVTELVGGKCAYQIYTAPTSNTDTKTQTLYVSRAFENGPITIEFTCNADANCLITRFINVPSGVTITGGHSYVYRLVSNSIGTEPLILAAIGDSIVQGAGATNPQTGCWVQLLNGKLINDGAITEGYRLGSGGNTSDNITAYSGGRPLYITSDVNIPASGGVTITLNARVFDVGYGTSPLNPCYIGGIKGEITYDGSKYTFTRSASGDARSVPSGTMVMTKAARLSMLAKYVLIEIGCNDGNPVTDSQADNIIENCKGCASLSKNGKYLVIGNYSTHDTDYLRGKYRDTFGQRYVDMYGYLSSNGVNDAVALGILPAGSSQSDWFTLLIKNDGVHPNDAGHAIWAEHIYKRIIELEWV